MSIIARTAGIGRSASELQWDLNYLLKLWTAIDGAAKGGKGAFLIYQESSLVIRAIRDYFNHDIGDILIDTDDIFDQAQQFMNHVMPETANRVKRYRDDAALFSRFQIEHQIETAFSRTVNLPSGGAIVIDHTEALVSVDVNSARAIKGGDIEETATRTNLEAAEEILLTVTDSGFGKRTSAYEYRVSGRGGQGIANITLAPRNGKSVVATLPVRDGDDVMLVTDAGRLIRVPAGQVRITGRQGMGVTLFRVDTGEHVTSAFPVIDDGNGDTDTPSPEGNQGDDPASGPAEDGNDD